MSFAVARRTAEFGVRIALGAPPSRMLLLVFRESMLPAVLGVAVGVPLVLVASRSLAGVLFGMPANDPPTLVLSGCVLVLVAALASVLPAWRASRVDPLVALRCE